MTISVSPLFEKGKTYSLSVLFVHKPGKYLNALDESGAAHKVEVPVAPLKGLNALKDKVVDFVCTEVTERGPEFALAEKYYAPAPKVTKGSNIGLGEGVTVEFKTSLIYSPTSHQPDSDQPFAIAREIAAFMNTNGGDLYMGVDDDGFVTGIERDYPVLGKAPLMMDAETDAKWAYGANLDGYKRKLTRAVMVYLGKAAPALMDEPEAIVDEKSGLTYLKVHVRPSDDVVYTGRDDEVFYRAGSSAVILKGRERDRYIRHRFVLRGEKTATDAIDVYKQEIGLLKDELSKMKALVQDAFARGNEKKLDRAISITGMKFKVEKDTCLPLDAKFLVTLEKPSGLAYKVGEVGQRLMPCTPKKTWQALYEQLLKLCAELDPVKFAALPDNEDFKPKRHCKTTKPNFVRKQDRIRLPSASDYIGDVRANLQWASKDSFLNDKLLPRRLMAYFGIAVEDIRIWNGNESVR